MLDSTGYKPVEFFIKLALRQYDQALLLFFHMNDILIVLQGIFIP